MDNYTRSCREWLDQRFRLTDKDGFYLSHQPVYGFNPTDSKLMQHFNQYTLTYSILLTLSNYRFRTFLDVGSAEGYTANTIRRFLGGEAVCAEISLEALKRARSLFDLTGVVCDAHALPFVDKAFDLVLCSETIEHVTNPPQVIAELKRVFRDTLVVTTPVETPAKWSSGEPSNHLTPDPSQPHTHIHLFSKDELGQLLGEDECYSIRGARSVLRGFNRLQQYLIHRHPRLWNKVTIKLLIWLNYVLASLWPKWAMHFICVKSSPRVTKGKLTVLKRLAIQIKLLDFLIARNVVPKLRLTHAGK